jgi:hypothetical protein
MLRPKKFINGGSHSFQRFRRWRVLYRWKSCSCIVFIPYHDLNLIDQFLDYFFPWEIGSRILCYISICVCVNFPRLDFAYIFTSRMIVSSCYWRK